MPPIDVSFSGDEQTYEPIPKGNYEAFVNSIQMKETQAKEPMANVRFVIADGQFKGRSLFSNFVLREDLKWKLQNLILASGLHTARTAGNVRLSDDFSELIGKRVGLKVADGEYNGEVRPEIRGFYNVTASASGSGPVMPQGAAPAKAPVNTTGAAPAAPPPPSAPAGATRRL